MWGNLNKLNEFKGLSLDLSDFQKIEYFTHYLTNEHGHLIEVPFRRGVDDGAFVDWVSFTFHKDTIEMLKGVCVSHADYVCAASELVAEIFGFGVTVKIGKGKYFYDACYRLGNENANYGSLHFGGQRDTFLVEITGKGCIAALVDWEKRLYIFGSKAIRFKLKRIDLTKDFFKREYSPEQAEIDHDNGLFVVKNQNPKSERIGTDWRSNDGSGKTFRVGARGSCKVARIYDKGKELGDKSSDICRFEVMFRDEKMKPLPLDMLLKAGQYLSGAYPLLNEKLFNLPVSRVMTVEVIANITFDEKLKHGKNQVGRLIRFLLDSGWSPDKIVNELAAEEGKYPKGLNFEEYDCRDMPIGDTYVHENGEETLLQELDGLIQQMPTKPVELSEDLKRWLRFKVLSKPHYFNIELSINAAESERLKQEEALDRYIDFIWQKYGTFFYKKEHLKSKT